MIPKKFFLLVASLLISSTISTAHAHTVDSVGNYRLEIGWMNEPVVSGETNGIELYVSHLEPNISVEEQEFKDGITGLEKTLKIQLVFKGEKVTLPLQTDHNIEGKYFAFVDPTQGGYYQANILGTIKDTTVSLSMHPPKVENKTYLQFPVLNNTIKAQQMELRSELDEINNILNRIEGSNQNPSIAYAGVGLGIAGIVIAMMAILKTLAIKKI